MTFLEAAVAVLKQHGRPLHFKKLVEIAVRQQLLSHVGRTPEETMQTQLANAIKRDPDRTPLVRVSPGVFGLKSYPPREAKEAAPEEPSPRRRGGRERPAAPAAKPPARSRRRGARAKGAAATRATHEGEEAEAPAAAKTAEKRPAEGAAAPATEERRRRRRPRRRAESKGGGAAATVVTAPAEALEGEGAPAAAPEETTVAPAEEAPAEAAPLQVSEPAFAGEAPEPLEEGAEMAGEAAPPLPEEEPPVAEPVAAAAPPAEVVAPAVPAEAERERREPPVELERREERVREERPRELSPADAAFEILRAQRDGRTLHARQIVDMATKRRLVGIEAPDPWRALRAAVVQDARERLASGLRPRFRIHGGGLYSLATRGLDGDLLAIERALVERGEELRQATRGALTRLVGKLGAAAFEQLGWLLLERLGHRELRSLRRSEGTAYLTCTRAALKLVVALRAGEVADGRRAVGDLRAEVQRAGARAGMLLCGGRLNEGAVAEAREPGPPISLYDGGQVAELCASRALGILRTQFPVEYLDTDFFADLLEG